MYKQVFATGLISTGCNTATVNTLFTILLHLLVLAPPLEAKLAGLRVILVGAYVVLNYVAGGALLSFDELVTGCDDSAAFYQVVIAPVFADVFPLRRMDDTSRQGTRGRDRVHTINSFC